MLQRYKGAKAQISNGLKAILNEKHEASYDKLEGESIFFDE